MTEDRLQQLSTTAVLQLPIDQFQPLRAASEQQVPIMQLQPLWSRRRHLQSRRFNFGAQVPVDQFQQAISMG